MELDPHVDSTSKSIRAHVFDHGSQSPRYSRTLGIPHSETQYSWKDMIRQQQEEGRNRSSSSYQQSDVPPSADPDYVQIPKWGTVYTTPTKTPRITPLQHREYFTSLVRHSHNRRSFLTLVLESVELVCHRK